MTEHLQVGTWLILHWGIQMNIFYWGISPLHAYVAIIYFNILTHIWIDILLLLDLEFSLVYIISLFYFFQKLRCKRSTFFKRRKYFNNSQHNTIFKNFARKINIVLWKLSLIKKKLIHSPASRKYYDIFNTLWSIVLNLLQTIFSAVIQCIVIF